MTLVVLHNNHPDGPPLLAELEDPIKVDEVLTKLLDELHCLLGDKDVEKWFSCFNSAILFPK